MGIEFRSLNPAANNAELTMINSASNNRNMALGLDLQENSTHQSIASRTASQIMELRIHNRDGSTENIFNGNNPQAIRNALTELGLNLSSYRGNIRDLRDYFLSHNENNRQHLPGALDTQIEGSTALSRYRRLNSFMNTWAAIEEANTTVNADLDRNEIAALNTTNGAGSHIDVYSFLLFVRWANSDTQVESGVERERRQTQRITTLRSELNTSNRVIGGLIGTTLVSLALGLFMSRRARTEVERRNTELETARSEGAIASLRQTRANIATTLRNLESLRDSLGTSDPNRAVLTRQIEALRQPTQAPTPPATPTTAPATPAATVSTSR